MTVSDSQRIDGTGQRNDVNDIASLRADFPGLRREINGKPMIYLDNAATAQKPIVTIDRIRDFYMHEYAKTQSEHTAGQHATQEYENVRKHVAKFVNAGSETEIAFYRGTTEAINVVANGYGHTELRAGDEIILTMVEHHSNIVPWLMACQQTGARIKVVPIDEDGTLNLEQFQRLFSGRTRLVAVTHVSNVLGTINPLKQMSEIAHAHGVPLLGDGAQGAPRLPLDVQDLGCDYYAFSSHKMYGPTGVGVLYGKAERLERLWPEEGGNPMAKTVTFESWEPEPLPLRLEAGVPAIAEVVGYGATLDYLETVDMQRIAAYESDLAEYAHDRLSSLDGVRILGRRDNTVSVVSFTVEGAEPSEVSQFLDSECGIEVRGGDMSAQPLMGFFGIPGAIRVSFSFYNTRAEADALVEGVERFIASR